MSSQNFHSWQKVEINAKIVVESVKASTDEKSSSSNSNNNNNNNNTDTAGYEVLIRCDATRERDGAIIAQGHHTVLVPDYMHM